MASHARPNYRLMLKHIAGLLGHSITYKFEEGRAKGQGSTRKPGMICVVTCGNIPLRSTASAATRNRAASEAARHFLVLLLAHYQRQILNAIVPSVSYQFPNISQERQVETAERIPSELVPEYFSYEWP